MTFFSISLPHLLLLLAAGFAAGGVNAIAGGGTILTFPALLLTGSDSIRANATSTLALIVGIVGSVYGYREHFAAIKGWLRQLLPVSLVGGLLGALLLTHTSSATFDRIVPFLLLFATVLFMFQGMISSRLPGGGRDVEAAKGPALAAIILQFFTAIYGGYFGAGIGILMLATLSLSGLRNLNHMSAVKTALGGLINVVAAVYFIGCGLIDWPKMTVIALGAIPGYYLGSLFTQRIEARTVRRVICGIGLVIAGYFFVKKFGGAA